MHLVFRNHRQACEVSEAQTLRRSLCLASKNKPRMQSDLGKQEAGKTVGPCLAVFPLERRLARIRRFQLFGQAVPSDQRAANSPRCSTIDLQVELQLGVWFSFRQFAQLLPAKHEADRLGEKRLSRFGSSTNDIDAAAEGNSDCLHVTSTGQSVQPEEARRHRSVWALPKS